MIREIIKQRIVDLGITQSKICEYADISTSTLSLYLKGSTNISLGKLTQILEALGLTFGFEGEMVGEKPPRSLNELIKARMEEMDLKQTDIAKEVGVCKATICTLLNEHCVGSETLEKIMQMLNLTIVCFGKPQMADF